MKIQNTKAGQAIALKGSADASFDFIVETPVMPVHGKGVSRGIRVAC